MNSIKLQTNETLLSLVSSAAITPRRKTLVAQWRTVDGKLICQWITNEDPKEDKKSTALTVISTPTRKSRLIAQWVKIEDQLVCQWVKEEMSKSLNLLEMNPVSWNVA